MDSRYAGGGGGGGCVSRYGVGGGCVARYGGGGGGGGGGGCGLYDISMVDRMMLKFRPIAPKPMASSGSGSGNSTTENGGKSGRSKRRYVRVKKGDKSNKNDKKRKVSTSSFQFQPSKTVSGGGDAVVTLSLMPGTPDRKKESPVICSTTENFDINVSMIKASKPSSAIWLNHPVVTLPVAPPQRQQTVSFVTVECVRETWVDGEWIGWTDEQRVKNMESDTCPGFISDGGDRVVWTNKAYTEMAGGGEVVVVLVRKEPPVSHPAAFTCSVRVTCRSGMPSSTLTVPCDAWRMGGGGGYAWRLDVKAALCLGR